MKISASIYSDKKRPLKEVIEDLDAHGVELLHVDCNDDLAVFEDIKAIRNWTNIPIDLHIITEHPEKYYDYLRQTPVEYVTFQYEDLKSPLEIPNDISGKKGLAIITPTSIDVFEDYPHFDFLLVMATIPGQSGGVFDQVNFSKIRQFKRKYPSKTVHVDGGVNGEVSFILRNMGVYASVSGSYLFNAPSIGHALMNLTNRNIESHFVVKDFMIPKEECPILSESQLNIESVLTSIDQGALGFSIVVDQDQMFKGIISNADVRKAMIKALPDLNALNPLEMLNRKPLLIYEDQTVEEMLMTIKQSPIPIMYLPVISRDKSAVGVVNFMNLVKGEL